MLREKEDATVLIKEMRERAYTEGYVIGVYDEIDDILINRMDEIREVLARIDQRKECQE